MMSAPALSRVEKREPLIWQKMINSSWLKQLKSIDNPCPIWGKDIQVYMGILSMGSQLKYQTILVSSYAYSHRNHVQNKTVRKIGQDLRLKSL